MKLTGKSVIITGASSGIGAAAARVFADAGMHVVLAARDQSRLERVAHDLPGRHLVVPADITNPASVAALVEQASAAFGLIDIVINNAGVGLASPVADLRPADMQAALAVNLFGPLALTQAALPHMPRGGQFIFISSVVGLRALPYLGGYAATKAALDRLTESLRVELHGSDIAVTLVRPGTTATGFSSRRLGAGRVRRRISTRAVSAEQVAHAILRAAHTRPRVAYVSLADRLTVWASLIAPRLTDRILGRSFSWEAGKS